MPAQRHTKVFSAGFWAALVVFCAVVALTWYLLFLEHGDKLSWKYPWGFLGLLGVPVFVGLARYFSRASVPYSTTRVVASIKPNWAARLQWLPSALRGSALVLFILALVGPQAEQDGYVWVEGIDVVVVLDTSRSMEAPDLSPNRITAGKRNIEEFLRERKNDQVGLVVFGQEAMVQAPLTSDYRALATILGTVRIGDVPANGTALGDGLALAVNQLMRSTASSKVVVLMSDGENNTSSHFTPQQAKTLAEEENIQVFTMLLGQDDAFAGFLGGVNPDLLQDIAKDTGGLYFNASDGPELEASFTQVRKQLEKERRRVILRRPPKSLHLMLVYIAIAFLGLELLARITKWRYAP